MKKTAVVSPGERSLLNWPLLNVQRGTQYKQAAGSSETTLHWTAAHCGSQETAKTEDLTTDK